MGGSEPVPQSVRTHINLQGIEDQRETLRTKTLPPPPPNRALPAWVGPWRDSGGGSKRKPAQDTHCGEKGATAAPSPGPRARSSACRAALSAPEGRVCTTQGLRASQSSQV